MKTKIFLPENNKDILIFLLINAILYVCLLFIRTHQAFIRFGSKIDIYPITKFMRGFAFGMSSDQLRWTSYLLLFLTSFIYLWVVAGAFRLGKISNLLQEKRMFFAWTIIPYTVLGIITIFLYPHVSTPLDTVDYAVHARIQTVYLGNPYDVPGATYSKEEPLTNYQEAKDRPSVYGPLWQFISLLPAAVGNGGLVGSIIAFKVMFFGVGLIALFLIWSFYANSNSLANDQLLPSAVLVAWNPLLHLVSHGDGHNDILMAIFVAAMIVSLNYRRPLLGFLSYGLSALVKFISAPILFPLVVYILQPGDKQARSAKIRQIIVGGGIVALLTLIAIAPFGISAILAGISGRYGVLVSSTGTSKISLVAGIVYGVTSRLGINVSKAMLTNLIGLALPVSWLIYVFIRSLSVRTINDVVKIILESYLFYITFVALPAYAQYMISPVIVIGFLIAGNWHRVAVVVTSLAFLWDQFFIVYVPKTPLIWENYAHPISHLLVVFIVLAYLAYRLTAFLKRIFLAKAWVR